MPPTAFAVTWDYRCPFARNLSEHVLVAQAGGAPWDVRFIPFSLDQAHVQEGEVDVWDDPDQGPRLLALQAGVVVRDRHPARFPDTHLALFAARHDAGRDIREEAVVADVLRHQGLDPDEVLGEVAAGWPRATCRAEHEEAVRQHHVFGVPTLVAEGQAGFVRVMHRPDGDAAVARQTVDRLLDLVTGWPELNELKHTTIPR